jgi:hypothetical protein
MSAENESVQKNPIPKNFQNQITNLRGRNKRASGDVNVIAPIPSGAIGTAKVKPIIKEQKEKEVVVFEKVAIHSTKNVYWPGVGKVSKGYNIIKRELAEKWLDREYIREATPQEIAREYGL